MTLTKDQAPKPVSIGASDVSLTRSRGEVSPLLASVSALFAVSIWLEEITLASWVSVPPEPEAPMVASSTSDAVIPENDRWGLEEELSWVSTNCVRRSRRIMELANTRTYILAYDLPVSQSEISLVE